MYIYIYIHTHRCYVFVADLTRISSGDKASTSERSSSTISRAISWCFCFCCFVEFVCLLRASERASLPLCRRHLLALARGGLGQRAFALLPGRPAGCPAATQMSNTGCDSNGIFLPLFGNRHMRVHLPMTIQALPGAIGPLPNVPFIPSDWLPGLAARSGRSSTSRFVVLNQCMICSFDLLGRSSTSLRLRSRASWSSSRLLGTAGVGDVHVFRCSCYCSCFSM